MGMAYGIGAAVVIAGALFKIMHWKGANEMLIAGMSTEVLIFLISAFEPIHEELDWTLVYPELAGLEGDGNRNKKSNNNGLSVSQELDKMLAEAKVGPELIEGLGSGLRSLSENVGNMADLSGATVATKEYAENISKASNNLGAMSGSYSRAIAALDSLADTTEAFKASASAITNVNSNLAAFDKNIQSLNGIYGGMLNAMRPNN
ncbi:MAG: gliding motility protein GldL [Flavobacteriales bacterium]|nr:gliding motility protein GldL [Flavobacteriales bacterium]